MKLALSGVNSASEEGGNKVTGKSTYDERVLYDGGDSASVEEYGTRFPPSVELGDGRKSLTPKPPPRNQGGYFAMIPLPLSMITIFTAIWLLVGSILDMILADVALADFVIDCYFIFFGFSILLITIPTDFDFANCLKRPRSSLEKWARFIATNWGRGYFMLFICVLAFSHNSWYRITMGIMLIVNGVFSIWCGRLAAKKYNRLREYLAAGNEGEALEMSIRGYQSKMMLVDGMIAECGLKSLIEYSGRFVTNSEVHAIFCFFDRDRTGKVRLNSFIERIMETKMMKSL